MIFKKRDKVRIVYCNEQSMWYPYFLKCKGKVGIITTVSKHHYIIDNNKYGINFKDEMLEIADINWKTRLSK